MKILIVSPYYPPDLGPSAPLLGMLAEDFVSLGNEVNVLAALPHYPSGNVSKYFKKKLIQWQICNQVKVGWIWIPSGNRANLNHRLLTFFVYQVISTIVGFTISYDVVIITNPALETGLPFVFLAWLRGKPVVFCVWDLYPEVGIKIGVFRNNIVINLIRKMEDFCLKRAQAVQYLAEVFKGNLEKRVSPSAEFVKIYPWLDADFIKPGSKDNAFSREFSLVDQFVVLYAGNIGLSQGLEFVLDVAEALENNQKIRFVFVGDGPRKDFLVSRSAELGLRNVQFIPFQPRDRLPDILASSDLALVSLLPEIGFGSIPSKTFPILASGRPVLAISEEGTELWEIIKESQSGVCVRFGEVDEMAKTISYFAEKPNELAEKGFIARKFAENNFSRKMAVQEFISILKRIVA